MSSTAPERRSVNEIFDVPDRLLSPAELASLARQIVAERDLWEPHVEHDSERRQFAPLLASEKVGIWVISWSPGHDTGFHDHAGTSGGVAVARGTIREERPVWNGEARRIDPEEGDTFSFDATEIHRVRNVSDSPAVSVHCYSPPLAAMGEYLIDDDGYVRREHVTWDRPLGSKNGRGAAGAALARAAGS